MSLIVNSIAVGLGADPSLPRTRYWMSGAARAAADHTSIIAVDQPLNQPRIGDLRETFEEIDPDPRPSSSSLMGTVRVPGGVESCRRISISIPSLRFRFALTSGDRPTADRETVPTATGRRSDRSAPMPRS
jgi:hypothetical protein